jgi:hypothetical protein
MTALTKIIIISQKVIKLDICSRLMGFLLDKIGVLETFSLSEKYSFFILLFQGWGTPINLLQISNFITFCEIIIIFVNAVIYMYLSCWWW